MLRYRVTFRFGPPGSNTPTLSLTFRANERTANAFAWDRLHESLRMNNRSTWLTRTTVIACLEVLS